MRHGRTPTKTPTPRSASAPVTELPTAADALLTRAQLATRWACSPGHLANLASAGRGPTYLKLGGSSVRYRLADVEAYEDACVVSSLEYQAGVSA